MLAAGYGHPPGCPDSLLHVSGLTWTTAVTFRPDVHATGVAAVSGAAAWVWGYQGRYRFESQKDRPFLALVEGGVVRQVSAPVPTGALISDVAAAGPGDAWLVAGGGLNRGGQFRPLFAARWDGASWHRAALPAGVRALYSLSTAGPSDAWAVATQGFDVYPRLLRWDGTAWSTAYSPPASLARDGRVPQVMTAASSAGHAWAAWTEAGTNSGSNGHNPPARTITAHFDGTTWRTVPVPLASAGLAEVTVARGAAWAITAYQNIHAILYSRRGGGWTAQPLPGRAHSCMPASISAASPAYAIAVTATSNAPCRDRHIYVYDGRRWRTASPRLPR